MLGSLSLAAYDCFHETTSLRQLLEDKHLHQASDTGGIIRFSCTLVQYQ